jgi:hypothetical protein
MLQACHDMWGRHRYLLDVEGMSCWSSCVYEMLEVLCQKKTVDYQIMSANGKLHLLLAAPDLEQKRQLVVLIELNRGMEYVLLGRLSSHGFPCDW